MRRCCLSKADTCHPAHQIAQLTYLSPRWNPSRLHAKGARDCRRRNHAAFMAGSALSSRHAILKQVFQLSPDRQFPIKSISNTNSTTKCFKNTRSYSIDFTVPNDPSDLSLSNDSQSVGPIYDWEDTYLNPASRANDRHPWSTKNFGRDLWSLWVGRQGKAAAGGQLVYELKSREINQPRMRDLCAQLLSGGRRAGNISQQWAVDGHMHALKDVMYFLFERGNTRLALRLLEAYLLVPPRGVSARGEYQAEVVDAVFSVLLKDTHLSLYRKGRRNRQYIQARIWKRSAKLIDLAVAMVKQNVFYGIKPQLKELIRTATPTKVLELYRSLRTTETFLAEGAHLMFLFHFARNSFFTEAFGIFQEICGLHGKLGDTWRSKARLWSFRELFVQLYRAGVPIHTSDLLKILISYNKQVDSQIYNAFLFSAAKAGDSQQALELYGNIEAVTTRPATIHVYTALFNMYHLAGNREGMSSMHAAASTAGLQPERDVFFVNAMLHAESRLIYTTYEQVLQRYRQFFTTEPLDRLNLPRSGSLPAVESSASPLMEPSTASVSIMLRAFFMQRRTFEGNTHLAWVTYQQYLRNLADPSPCPQFAKPSEHIFSLIVATLGLKREELPRAVMVLQHMLTTPSLPNPTIITWNPLMRSYARHGDVSGAEKVWDLIVGHGLRPDEHSYNAMILAHVRGGSFEEAGCLLARMLKEGWKWNAMTHRTVDQATNKIDIARAFRQEAERLSVSELGEPTGPSAKAGTPEDSVSEMIYEELPL